MDAWTVAGLVFPLVLIVGIAIGLVIGFRHAPKPIEPLSDDDLPPPNDGFRVPKWVTRGTPDDEIAAFRREWNMPTKVVDQFPNMWEGMPSDWRGLP